MPLKTEAMIFPESFFVSISPYLGAEYFGDLYAAGDCGTAAVVNGGVC